MGGRGRAEQHPCQGSRCLFRLRHLSCQLPFLWKPALLAPSPACTPANSRKPTFCSLRSCLDGDTTLGQAAMSPCPPLTGGHAKLRVGAHPYSCSPEQGRAGRLLIPTLFTCSGSFPWLSLLSQPPLSVLPHPVPLPSFVYITKTLVQAKHGFLINTFPLIAGKKKNPPEQHSLCSGNQ